MRLARVVAALVLGWAMTACGSGEVRDVRGARSVEHAFGTTTVPTAPKRVVTLGWGSTEAALAMGVVPIAIPNGKGNGGIDGGLHPWVATFLEARGLDAPKLLSANAGARPPYEEIAALKPDLVLAVEAGLEKDQYAKLSAIAPTVAHPGKAWETPWRDVISIAGRSLGREDEADRVLAGIAERTKQASREHPEFTGRTLTAATVYDGEITIFTAKEPRSKMLEELGFDVDSYGQDDPWYELSFEQADRITSDVLLMYFQSEAERREFEASPAARILRQYDEKRVATVVGGAEVAAVSPPTALSWDWARNSFVDELAQASRRS